MRIIKPINDGGHRDPADTRFVEEVTERDEKAFLAITSTALDSSQEQRVAEPGDIYAGQKSVFALHWHPEFIPLGLIKRRVAAMFPGREEELIIPTQHNEFMSYDSIYSGAELDCYSRGFNQKVQLLIHVRSDRLENAGVLKAMAEYTFKYRSSQLFNLLESFMRPDREKLNRAVTETGVDEDVVEFARLCAAKVHAMIDRLADHISPRVIKNNLMHNFMDSYRTRAGNTFVNSAQAFLKAVKEQVKAKFPHHHFYRTSEVIEEARAVGAGIVIPHPEQFWPILLADYDVDGIEVWNPQSMRYTDFLISVIGGKNAHGPRNGRRLLVLMGDDTHMSEKVKDHDAQNAGKLAREVGLQAAWDDIAIRKSLILQKMEKSEMLREYRARIG